MVRTRVIPTLLIEGQKLVKGKKFNKHRYIGDPINAIKIFNEKEVDELLIFDRQASSKNGPNFDYLSQLCSEAFFPVGYGGAVSSLSDVKKLLRIGIEKVVFNTTAFFNPDLIKKVVNEVGAQSVVVCIDYKKTFFHGSRVFVKNGNHNTKITPLEYAQSIQDLGIGEVILTNIDKEGSYTGYDIELLKEVSQILSVPVVANGGAGDFNHMKDVITQTNVHAVAAGSLFVFYGPLKAVLINYPKSEDVFN